MEHDAGTMSRLSVGVVVTDVMSLRALILASLGMELVMIVPLVRMHKFWARGRSGH